MVDEERERFREKLRSLSFHWRGGGGYTKQDFHDRTNAEFVREFVDRTDGRKIEPVGERWV